MIIAVLNGKGGCGKTTTATNLAVHFARSGMRVLLVDADPQRSASKFAAARQAEALFPTVGMARPTMHKDLPGMARDYDLTLIDGAPQLKDIGRSAILAADLVLLPVQPSPYDVWEADETVALVREARVFKETLKATIVISRKIVGTAIGRDVEAPLAELGLPVIAGTCQRVVYAESAAQGLGVEEITTEAARQAAQEIIDLAAAIGRM